jgi:predicted permease
MPLFVALGGLVVPPYCTTLSSVSGSAGIELLVALPVSLRQILWSKLLAVLALTSATTIPFFVLQQSIALSRGWLTFSYVAALFVLLLAAEAYSASSALVVALMARDYRTANNISGALLGPLIVLILTFLSLTQPGEERLFVLSFGLIVLAAASLFLAVRVISLERFLR